MRICTSVEVTEVTILEVNVLLKMRDFPTREHGHICTAFCYCCCLERRISMDPLENPKSLIKLE